jgi:hypothetical protein
MNNIKPLLFLFFSRLFNYRKQGSMINNHLTSYQMMSPFEPLFFKEEFLGLNYLKNHYRVDFGVSNTS